MAGLVPPAGPKPFGAAKARPCTLVFIMAKKVVDAGSGPGMTMW
jgi:hypothetical protein